MGTTMRTDLLVLGTMCLAATLLWVECMSDEDPDAALPMSHRPAVTQLDYLDHLDVRFDGYLEDFSEVTGLPIWRIKAKGFADGKLAMDYSGLTGESDLQENDLLTVTWVTFNYWNGEPGLPGFWWFSRK